ncbi:hypothetical protein M0802_016945 [Mischocyttarus mexicanus]|nr:hypothetical protein M0802_016945 [Mischocyttarus mexicanus]
MTLLNTKTLKLVDKFNPKRDNIFQWLDFLEYGMDGYMIVKKSEYLLNMIERSDYKEIREYLAPVDPINVPYETIASILLKKYSNLDEDSATIFRIGLRKQFIGESVKHYFKVLSKLINKVYSGSQANDKLLYQFQHGLRDKETCQKLIKTPNLTLETALNVAENIESEKEPFVWV